MTPQILGVVLIGAGCVLAGITLMGFAVLLGRI